MEIPDHIPLIKTAVGIETANCETCSSLGHDGDGPEYNGYWFVCTQKENYSYLKSFPFKKEMKCWSPNFWASKFAGTPRNEDELLAAANAFHNAVETAEQGLSK